MAQLNVAVSANIPAAAERIYSVFADYRTTHPQILPRPYFLYLDVEKGGYGAGTVFRTALRVFGQQQAYHMQVSEPQPGRVLMESGLDSDMVTTFSVTPTDPQRSEVTIASTWTLKPGFAGFMERLMTPPVMRMLYRKELQNVAAFVAQQVAAKPS